MEGKMRLNKGYVVVSGPFADNHLDAVLFDVDRAIAEANPSDIHMGSTATNIRVEGIFGRAPALAAILTHEPLARIAAAMIGAPFKLSSFHLRTVVPGASAQALHQDVKPGEDGWPLVGFIFMVDEFTSINGATRFVPGTENLRSMEPALRTAHPREEQACGPAGSLIVFNGSIWHGFGANKSARPRRAIYGALIPRTAGAARDHWASLSIDVREQFGPELRAMLSAP
jgi:hypothetical protein